MTTIPLRDALSQAPRRLRRRPAPRFSSARDRRRRERATVLAALVVIVLCTGAIVLAAADRPSLLAATTQSHFFPRWMAGPLGGLWPALTRSGMIMKDLFSSALVVMFVCWVVALKRATHIRARWAIGALVTVNAILLLAPPLALTDVFNYINYARMEAVHHLNPYTTIPALEPHSDPSFALSNWHGLLSPYGPLFTLITLALVPLGVAGAFWAMKVILVCSSLAIAALVWRCARLVGRDPVQALIFTSLNPIVLVWGLGGDHNDFLMVLFIVAAIYLLLRGGALPGLLAGAPAPERSSGLPGGRLGEALTRLASGARAAREGARVAAANGNGHTGNGHAGNGHTANDHAGNGHGNGQAGSGHGSGYGHGNGHTGDGLEEAGNGAPVAAPARVQRIEGATALMSRAPAGTLARALGPEATAGVALAGAGAALAAAAAIKASAAILVPVLLAALLRSPRRLAWFSFGLVATGVALGVASYLAFGPHLPDLGTQGSVVTTMSVPNLIGLALTLGGENTALHALLSGALVILILACCVSAWRTRDPITAGGWATIALVVTLSWVLPWYVMWVLPLAALSRSRRLRIASVALGAYLILAWMPVTSTIRAGLGLHPEKTRMGLFHQHEVKELMN